MRSRILVVDDDPEIVKVISLGLINNGYELISAVDGNEGLRIAKQQKPDLIIMDIMMPNLEGGDAVRLLKADITTKNIPIIFLTAVVANMPEGAEGKSINVDGHFFKAIAKPFEPENLLSEIKKLIKDR